MNNGTIRNLFLIPIFRNTDWVIKLPFGIGFTPLYYGAKLVEFYKKSKIVELQLSHKPLVASIHGNLD